MNTFEDRYEVINYFVIVNIFVFSLEPDMASNSPPPLLEEEQEKEKDKDLVHEVILEDEEERELEEFVCDAENKEVVVEQEAWEEETVHSVVETASQIQGRGKWRILIGNNSNDIRYD